MERTIDWAIGEVILRENKGKPSDDTERDHRQILEELDEVRNELLPDYIKYEMGGDIPSSVLKRVDCVTVTRETPVCVSSECFSRDYVQLPEDVVQLERELGVHRMFWTGTGVAIDRLVPGEMDLIKDTRFGKPSQKKPAWSKLGTRLYLIGGRFLNCKFSIDYIPRMHVLEEKVDYQNIWYVPSALENMIIDTVVAKGLQQKQLPQDITNDSKD